MDPQIQRLYQSGYRFDNRSHLADHGVDGSSVSYAHTNGHPDAHGNPNGHPNCDADCNARSFTVSDTSTVNTRHRGTSYWLRRTGDKERYRYDHGPK
jgi:hypothetical protein